MKSWFDKNCISARTDGGGGGWSISRAESTLGTSPVKQMNSVGSPAD